MICHTLARACKGRQPQWIGMQHRLARSGRDPHGWRPQSVGSSLSSLQRGQALRQEWTANLIERSEIRQGVQCSAIYPLGRVRCAYCARVSGDFVQLVMFRSRSANVRLSRLARGSRGGPFAFLGASLAALLLLLNMTE